MYKLLKIIILILFISSLSANCSTTYTQFTKDSVLFTVIVSSNNIINYGDTIQMDVKIENIGKGRILLFDYNSIPYDKRVYEIYENYFCIPLGGEWRYEIGIKQPEVKLQQLESNDIQCLNYTFIFNQEVKYDDSFQHPFSQTLDFNNLILIEFILGYSKDLRIAPCRNNINDTYYVIHGRENHLGLYATLQQVFFPITIQDFRKMRLKK